MPELPEVETAVRALRAPLIGRTILSAHFPEPPRRMTNLPPDLFAERISGAPIQALNRRAKYLIFQLSGQSLIVHLKMSGHLYVVPREQADPMDRWLRVRFLLDDGAELRFSARDASGESTSPRARRTSCRRSDRSRWTTRSRPISSLRSCANARAF